jgi:choline dehydrogenase-like flavoprotein
VTAQGRSTASALDLVLQRTSTESLRKTQVYDAIVVGGGAAGGLAALLLAEAGRQVLVLDAGWPVTQHRSWARRLTTKLVRRLADPRILSIVPPGLVPLARDAISVIGRPRQPIQSTSYAWMSAPDAYVDDLDSPYVTPADRPFTWIRARQLGGRMTIPWHGRQYLRFGGDDFRPDDGASQPWPLAAGELNAWYVQVERRLRLSGSSASIPWLPDSELARELTWSEAEAAIRQLVNGRWPHAPSLLGRHAPPLDALELAAATGRLSCRQGAVVRAIDVDNAGRVSGVSWLDEETRTTMRAHAPIVFLCASALESTRILMLSRSANSPRGLGGGSGELGRNLMDHLYVKMEGQTPARIPPSEAFSVGRCVYLPRFDARGSSAAPGGRGFGVQVSQFSAGWGTSYLVAASFGEMLPHPENHISLDATRCDAWGIPILRIDCRHMRSDLDRAAEQADALRELAATLGIRFPQLSPVPAPPGASVHECGTARMGTDPSSSVLDRHNQCWEAQGLYVTDGACFPSQGCQNPTLTIMALTARACDHALGKGWQGA